MTNKFNKKTVEFAAKISEMVANQMLLDAVKVNKGEMTVEQAADNIGKMQDKINEEFPGLGGLAIRIAQRRNEACLD